MITVLRLEIPVTQEDLDKLAATGHCHISFEDPDGEKDDCILIQKLPGGYGISSFEHGFDMADSIDGLPS